MHNLRRSYKILIYLSYPSSYPLLQKLVEADFNISALKVSKKRLIFVIEGGGGSERAFVIPPYHKKNRLFSAMYGHFRPFETMTIDEGQTFFKPTLNVKSIKKFNYFEF